MPSAFAAQDSRLDAGHFPVSDQVTLAGLPSRADLVRLQHDNTLVIDLREASERAADKGQFDEFDVTHFPSGRHTLSNATVKRFATLMQNAGERPVFIHCASGNRAGLLWASYLIQQGTSPQDALQTVDKAVTSKRIEDAIKQYKAVIDD